MKTHITLIAGAALGALAVSATAVDAKAMHRHHKPTGPSETALLKQEVETLKTEVQSLERRLDAQGQAQQQTLAQAQAAQSQAQNAQVLAQAAATQVTADDSKIAMIPTQVEAATKAHAPKPGWWNDTKVGATVFADASYIRNQNSAGKTPQTGTNYDIKRLYLIVEHRFNDTYSFNFTSDFIYDSGAKATQLFIKKAYLQAHYSDAFNVRLGSAELPWVPFVESLYPYRYVSQMLIDRTKNGTTTDWGVHVSGTFLDKVFGYQFSVVDGEGFKQPAIGTANRTNALDVEGRINATYDHVTVAVGGYSGKLGNSVEGTPTFNTAERFDAVVAYTDSKIRLGGEYFHSKYWGDVKNAGPATTNSADGISAFGSYALTSKVAVFGRYDWVKPKTNTAPTMRDNYFNVGVAYKPIGPLDFALVYKRENVDNGSFSTSDGVIGIPAGATTGRGTYDEIGLFTQVKF